jgi:hypothetical protein
MGTVITFPTERSARDSTPPEQRGGEATVVILPVIRIERHDDRPSGVEPNATSPRRRRRKR